MPATCRARCGSSANRVQTVHRRAVRRAPPVSYPSSVAREPSPHPLKRRAAASRHGTSPRLSGRPVVTVGSGFGAKSCVSGSLWGSPDTTSPSGRIQPRSYKSLALLQLGHGWRSADADPRSLDVAGSDPPSRQTSIGAWEDGAGQPHPPRRCGVAPSQRSVPEGCRAPRRGGASPARRPVRLVTQGVGQPACDGSVTAVSGRTVK